MWATVKAHNPPVRLMRTNLVAADTQNKLHRRPTNYNHPTTHQGTRPAPICAPRGGQRYNPRPEPRRRRLTHAADMGHTSPQRRHQHKAPCIVPLPGAAAATYDHKPKPPCHVSIKDTKQGGFIFYCDKTRGRTEWMRYETSYHVKASGTGTINVSVRSVSTADSNRNTITSTVFAVGAIFFGFPSCGILSGCTGAVANLSAKILIKEEHPP